MRALGLGTKIVTACGAAAALVGSLRLPWYGAVPPRDGGPRPGVVDGPLDGLFAAIPRWFAESSGATGWDLAGLWAPAFAAGAAAVALAAVLCLLPSTEHAGRGLLRLGTLVILGGVLFKLFGRPPGIEPRHGIFVALGLAALLVTTAQGVAACHLRGRPAAVLRYAGTAPRRAHEPRPSVAPPSPLSPAARALPGAGVRSSAAREDDGGIRSV